MTRERPVDIGPLVGRRQTIDLALAVLARPRSSHRRRSVVLAGEAGVGKSRLADEVVAALAETGVETAVVRLNASMAALPLGALASVVPVPGVDHGHRAEMLVAVAERLAEHPDRLVVIDDAHLADPASAAVLHLAASRERLRLLLTVRSGEPVDDAIAALWKDDLAERIDLDPLDRAETDDLAAGLLGAPLDAVSRQQLWDVAQGNALFVRELLIGSLDDGLLTGGDEVYRFAAPPRSSARLTELLGARLAGVDIEQREVLDLLALGGELGLEVLRSVASDVVLAELEARGLLDVRSDGRRVPVRLAHPLYGELLREQMGKVRELATYRRLADRLEAVGARRRNDVLDLARWRMLGGGVPRNDLLVQAARQALARFDAELAHDLARFAADHGAGVEADLVAAEALAQQGRHGDAAAALTETLARAESDDAIVGAATALSVTQFWSLRDEAAATSTVLAARSRLREVELINQLEAHLATFTSMANRPVEALEQVAPHLAPTAARDRAFTVAAMAAGPTLTVVGRGLDALELLAECVPLRLSHGDDEALPDAFKYTMAEVFARSEVGELQAAATLAAGTSAMVIELRAVPAVAWSAMLEGRVALMRGDLALAVERCGEAARLFGDLGEGGLRAWSMAGVVMATAMSGDVERTAERRALLDAVDPGPVLAMQADMDRARAWSVRSAGDSRGARTILLDALADADRRGAWGMSVSLLHDLVRVGGDRLLPKLRPEHRAVQGQLGEARIHLVTGTANDDVALLEAAAARFEAVGSPLFAAEAAAAAAAAHRRAGATRRAASWWSRSRSLADRCTAAATPLLSSVDAHDLTAREREVAELAAAGHSSREIATQLDRSVRTVENHLQRVYDKLGVDGRPGLREAMEPSLGHEGRDARSARRE